MKRTRLKNKSYRELVILREAEKAIPKVGRAECVTFIAERQMTLAVVISALVKQAGPCKVGIATFCVTAGSLELLLSNQDIQSLDLLVDISQTKKNKEILEGVTGKVRIARTHIKAVAIIGEELSFDVTTSANLTRGRSLERYTIIEEARSARRLLEFIRHG